MCITREAEATFGRLLAQYKAVLVTGPCQVGKSTMIGLCQGETCGYVMLNDPIALYRATRDPVLFFQDHPLSLVIDEAQYAPELFRCMKLFVDASDKRGRVVLTGSQSYRLMHGVSESLAGRVGILDLSGVSLREELNACGRGAYIPGASGPAKVARPENIRGRIWRGDMPEVVTGTVDWATYYANYERTYLERDVRDMSAFYRFLVAMAARTGQLLNMSDIANDADVDAKTVSRWLSLLEASGIVLRLQPYFPYASKRVSRTPKLHFMDTGLVAHLRGGLITPDALARGAMAGALFESYVVGEIARSRMNAGRGVEGLHYYRDTRKREIDLPIVEGRVVHPVEVKAGANPGRDDIGSFLALDALKGVEVGDGAVVCRAPRVYAIGERVKAVPIWAL